MVRTLFFDTYAFFELIEGNCNYDKYTKGVAVLTSKMNLLELHYGLLVKFGKDFADNTYDELVKFTIEITDEIIKKASEFRALFKKRDLSYVDCIGYIIAKTRNVPFLTGDQQFGNLDNVEFVK